MACRRCLLQANRKSTTRLLPLDWVTGTSPASAWRWRKDCQRLLASPSSAQSLATVVPLFPPGRVFTSCRHRGEKTFDFLTVAFYFWQQGLKLNHQCQQKFRLGSNNVFGNGQLSLAKLIPKLGRARLAQMMVTLGKSVPALAVKFRESLRGGIRLEKIARDLALQIAKNLQRPRVVLFESDPDLIEKPRFLTHKSLVIPTEHLKFLCLCRVRLKSSKMCMIGPQKLRQYIGIKGVAFRLAHAKAIPGPIQRFGIDRINHHSVIQKKIHNPPMRLLDRRPQLYLFSFSLMQPSTEFAHGLRLLKHHHLDYFLAF